VKDILEIDAGVIIKVFDINSYNFDDIEPKSGAPMLKPAGQRRMTELYARDGASFLKEIDKFGFENGYWQYSYQIPAHPMWFNKEEVVYVSEHPRSMSCYGYARTQAILDIVKSLHYSTLWNKRFFEETAIPDGLLSMEDTNEEEMKAFMTYWNNEFKAQPHKIGAVNKKTSWMPFSLNQKDLDFLQTQKWYFNMVVSMFGLTPSELGVTEDVNRATSATQSELVKRKSIRPFLKLLEGFINNKILTEFDSEGVEFQFIYDDPAEKKLRLDNWKLEIDIGVKTVNEVRNELGLEPVEGGDLTGFQRQQQMFTQQSQGRMGIDGNVIQAEESQSPGYEGERNRAEGKGETSKGVSYCDTCGEPFSTNRESAEYPGTCGRCVQSGRLGKADTKTMPLKELITEHENIVRVLESGTDEEKKKLLDEQRRELGEYKDEANTEKDGEPFGKPGLGHSDKWWEVYHALTREGHSKASAARIANSKDV
jgi:HK97 family phage portal protein